jgi:hypothetical protein
VPLYLSGLRVVMNGLLGVVDPAYGGPGIVATTNVLDVWSRIGPLMFPDLSVALARAMLLRTAPDGAIRGEHGMALGRLIQVMRRPGDYRFPDDVTLMAELRSPKIRLNHFFELPGEDENFSPVIYATPVRPTSIGWSQQAFFEQLGDPRHDVGSVLRNAEQEYLLQGMVKGAMWEAFLISQRFDVGIAVRPTGVLAHMAIEAGNPTKAQEFKNKTSKDVDLFLCDELQPHDVGAVVHYNPRKDWSSRVGAAAAAAAAHPPAATHDDWLRKRRHIEDVRIPALQPMITVGRVTQPPWPAIEAMFFARAAEFDEEDYAYRLGPYAPHTRLEGVFVRLALRPDVNMYGDHDLFGFARNADDARLTLDTDDHLRQVQRALQMSREFQAQHGGIWNWRPAGAFNVGIKQRILAAHSPPDGDPLLYFMPGGDVRAVFFIPGRDVLEPVWDHPRAVRWLEQTFSGRQHLEAEAAEAEVTPTAAELNAFLDRLWSRV